MTKRKTPAQTPAVTTAVPEPEHPIKIPRTFSLAGIHWRVEDVPGLSELGLCDWNSAVIRLRVGMQEQIRADVFYHELIHAIMYATGLQEHPEREVDALGTLLHQFEQTKEY